MIPITNFKVYLNIQLWMKLCSSKGVILKQHTQQHKTLWYKNLWTLQHVQLYKWYDCILGKGQV